jgi:hypothetical protein
MKINETELKRTKYQLFLEMIDVITTEICEIKREEHGHVIGFNQKQDSRFF